MYKIGQVEEITKVSKKTLRYWEELGLIAPKEVDKFTSYRYYDDACVDKIGQIVYLKKLGFSLKEIKNLDEKVVTEKIEALKQELSRLKASLNVLLNIKKDQSENYLTDYFILDKEAIGHWKLIGESKTEQTALKGEIYKDTAFSVKDLYLMDGGKQYWIIKWTKGIISINGDKHSYEIYGDKLILTLCYEASCKCRIYERVDNINHSIEEIAINDNIDLPFVRDREVEGVWQYCGFYSRLENIDLKAIGRQNVPDNKYYFMPDGNLFYMVGHALSRERYTKGHILNENRFGYTTDEKYWIKKEGDNTFLISESKASGYTFAKKISYVVYKKIEQF